MRRALIPMNHDSHETHAMTFAIKVAIVISAQELHLRRQKTMYGGKRSPGDAIFISRARTKAGRADRPRIVTAAKSIPRNRDRPADRV